MYRKTKAKTKSQSFDRKNYKKDESKEIAKEKYNDPNWYTAAGQLLKDVASLSFNNALGVNSLVKYENDDGDYSLNNVSLTVPGIMAIHTAPSFGISENGSSALNLAAKNFYTWIRHQNSGHVNYDSPDLMLYFGAMDSIYALIAHFMRAYGVARVYSQVNRYVGDPMLTAMGFNPDDLRKNLADFRAFINMIITKVSAFCTPITMTMYKRHFWMYSGIYKDESSVKSQVYMYVPGILWKYSEMSGTGQLQAVAAGDIYNQTSGLGPNTWSVASWEVFANSLISALVASEDINIMSGDILKAYGREGLWSLTTIPEDYAVVPVFSQEVLDQIHNTKFAGNFPVATLDLSVEPTASLNRLGVIQSPSIGDGALYFQPQFRNAAHLGFDPIVDLKDDNPTPEQVMVATRNELMGKSSAVTASGSTNVVTTLTTAGSDICTYAVIYVLSAGTLNTSLQYLSMRGSFNATSVTPLWRFNKAPLRLQMDSDNSITILGEIDNYTVISFEDIKKIHDTAILSLLGVPFLGTGNTVK